uniref:Uncharacterized protein n=1 Tax=Fagus sylvatica TaxID=28930 RepID=A0A2N9GDS0_FAGSY
MVRGIEVGRRFLDYRACASGNGGFNDDSMFQRRVTRVVILPVGVSETSFRQDLAFNEKTSFRRFAENNLGPPPLEGYISSDSVLHRLAVELYSIVCPVLTSWEGVRNRMAANEAEWSLPLSDELPEGLSDESPGRVTREDSSEAAPSTSGTRQSGWVDRSWKALSYFSSVTQDDIDRIRRRYQIPDDVVLRIPDSDERACLSQICLAPGQVNPNGWRTIIACMVMWRVSSNGGEDLTVDEFLFCYEPCQIALSRGFWTFKNRDANTRVVQGLPTSDRIWKDKYFFVCGDNWERLPQEDPRDFVGVRRSWGTPSPSVLDRPLLNSVWQERIWRILEIEDRRYNIFIEPDLLATFSLGPVPSSSVKALQRANKKRINTMKLNKSRLKQMAQSGEVAAAPISLKRKKPDEGIFEAPKKLPQSSWWIRILTPPSAASTINQSPLVAMDRAKSALTSQDMEEYAVAPYGRPLGLTEAMVMSRRCASVEEDLAALRAKSMADEAKLKNVKRAVMELTRDRKEAMAEAEDLRKELKAREDDIKAAVEAKDKAEADFKHLFGQIEGAKEAAVSDFRASEAFEDVNTRYFLSGFEAFRKQAVQRFPDLDFSALQPYDDEDSVMDASQDQAGDEDVTSK